MESLNLWQDTQQAKSELAKRFDAARSARLPWEKIWRTTVAAAYRNKANEEFSSLFAGSGMFPPFNATGDGYQLPVKDAVNSPTTDYSEAYCNYINKDLRYMLSQLANNPPSVIPQPTSSDPSSRKAADAANNVCKYMVRQYRLPEKKDACALWTHVVGTGITRAVWDPSLGDPTEFNPATGEVLTEGDISITVPSVWDVYIDPVATNFEEVRYYFQRFRIAKEEALRYFGDTIKPFVDNTRHSKLIDTVEVLQYWEKGLAVNAFQGRFCWCMEDGTVLGERIIANPHGPLTKLKDGSMFRKATLPIHIFTDIDVPGAVYGIPTILFTAELQHELNVLTRMIYTCVRANGTSHMIIHEDAELSDQSITNDPLDIIEWSGTGPAPTLMTGQPISPIVFTIWQSLAQQIPDLNGINESMQGKMGRETSGSAMNFATQNGQALRARTFAKYVQYVEDLYTSLLLIAQEKWTTPRLLVIEGKEKAFNTIQFKSSDIESGYAFSSRYGTDFSLDPTQRRKEILELWPILKEMGLDPRQMGSLLKLNDLDAMLSTLDLAFDRQREVFDRMIADPEAKYISPIEGQDHENMLKYAQWYTMTAEFSHLDNPKVKANIQKHIKERTSLMAASKSANIVATAPGGAPPAVPGGAPAPQGPQDLSSILGSM